MKLVTPADVMNAFRNTPGYATLGWLNLKARNAISVDDYARKYEGGLLHPSEIPEHTRVIIRQAVSESSKRCKQAGLVSLGKMQWNLAVSGKSCENGWAHTLGDIMIIPEHLFSNGVTESLKRTLVHEAVHVAQRRDPVFADRYSEEELGFVKESEAAVRRIAGLGEHRFNPDTDGELWSRSGRIVHPILREDCEGLGDVYHVPNKTHGFAKIKNHEHPYEIMAESLAMIVYPI